MRPGRRLCIQDGPTTSSAEVIVDADNEVVESREDNNVWRGPVPTAVPAPECTPAPTTPPTPTPGDENGPQTVPPWYVDPYSSNIAIIALDYQTLRLKNAYFTRQVPCDGRHPPVDDEELRWRASGLFAATGRWVADFMDEQPCPIEKVNFHISRVGDFVVLYEPAVDFGGVAVSHPCSGLVLFAGSVVWAGRGRQLYPADPILPEALEHTPEQAPPPQRIDIWGLGGELEDVEDGMAAWNSVRGLNLVKDLASAPYSVLVYLYPRSVGLFDPDSADWVIFVHRGLTG
ncbi:MAG: hypothetical protein ACE5LU_10425 [Anaerolineae bacterium]